MADVKKTFEDAGMCHVETVLATGNVIFTSEKTADELKMILEKTLSETFHYEAFLFIKTKEEVISILKNSPFEKKENLHNYVFISLPETENVLMEQFRNSEKTENEEAEIVKNTFYWQVPKGSTLNSSFGKILGKKDLKSKITSRNINTFEKIVLKF